MSRSVYTFSRFLRMVVFVWSMVVNMFECDDKMSLCVLNFLFLMLKV